MLGDMTAMFTLALARDDAELDRYVADLGCPREDIEFLLRSAVTLYAEAFARLGQEQGFDPVNVSRRIALQESCERWGVTTAD
jgi:hypothetical protein